MKILCCGCDNKKIDARLTNGREVYPHREDLFEIPFWKCDTCGNFVGCHHKTDDPTKPLGCIVTKEIKTERYKLHKIIDPLWKIGNHSRTYVYKWLSKKMGKRYHTGNVKNMKDVNKVIDLINEFKKEHRD